MSSKSYRGKWLRPDGAKDSYAIEKVIGDGNLPLMQEIAVDVPAAADLPDAFVTAYFAPRNLTNGSEKILLSGIPFKVGDTWVWLGADTWEDTSTNAETASAYRRFDRGLVRVDPGVTFANLEKVYVITGAGATQGLVTNVSTSNDEIGVSQTKDADKYVFASGAQTAGETLDFILPDGTYIWISKDM